MLTAVSLFAGVGGIDLALTRAGVEVTAAVEIDDAARGVMADRLPHTTLFTDVTKVTADELRATGFVPERGILAAGWPCQGNSVAGRRKGLADPRSGLWRHVVRLLAELRPAWFLGENVPGLLSVTDGEDFGIILRDVADVGMGFAYRVLDAQFFGVPQRRRRVFIVGRAGDDRGPVQVLLEPEGGGGNPPAGGTAGQDVAATLTRGTSGTGVSSPGRRQEEDVNLVVQPVALRGRVDGAELEIGSMSDPAHALRTPGGGASHGMVAVSATGSTTHIVSTLQGGGRRGHRIDAEAAAGGHLVTFQTAHTLTSEGHDASEDGIGRGTPVVAFHMTQDPISGDVVPAMGRKSGGNGVMTETVVRRLTPRECERLQGFPDDWTATSNGKPQADSARYRQMGNAVAVPCVEWIARRIVGVA